MWFLWEINNTATSLTILLNEGDAAYQRALKLAQEILPNGPIGVKMAKNAITKVVLNHILIIFNFQLLRLFKEAKLYYIRGHSDCL